MEWSKIKNLPQDCVIGKQFIPKEAVHDPDVPCIVFMNAATFATLPELPNDSVVLTEELNDGQAVVVPKMEFTDWLMEKNAEQGD